MDKMVCAHGSCHPCVVLPPEDAVDALIEAVLSTPGTEIITLGPLTNLAFGTGALAGACTLYSEVCRYGQSALM